jgi:hypothetical protein
VCALFTLTACGGAGQTATAQQATAGVASPASTANGSQVTPDFARFTPAPGQALLEPATGAYFGVNLDWGSDSAAAFNARLGAQATVYVTFVAFPLGDADKQQLDQFFGQVANAGGMGVVTLEPTVALSQINPAMIADLVNVLQRRADPNHGVFVRFAHEMNGSWYRWGQQPVAYVAAFRMVAAAVHAEAPGVAMLWAPNYGAGYPFAGGQYATQPGADGFALLDTNHDGQLDAQDDPYAPYYPGDDAVDWVGLSLYHWGDTYPWGENEIPEAHKFVDQLTGVYNGRNGDERGVPDFYATFADGHQKPLAIVETAALYNTTVGGADELAIKQAWWRQVFAPEVATRFPRLKMINWFEWRKPESELGGATVDWTVTQTPSILAAFQADFPRDRFVPTSP